MLGFGGIAWWNSKLSVRVLPCCLLRLAGRVGTGCQRLLLIVLLVDVLEQWLQARDGGMAGVFSFAFSQQPCQFLSCSSSPARTTGLSTVE